MNSSSIQNSSWKNLPMGDTLSYMGNGTTANQNQSKIGLKVTRIETISEGIVNYKKVGYIDESETNKKYKLQNEDVLFSHINSVKHIAKVALYRGEQPLYHGMNLLVIRANPEIVRPVFLFYWLSSSQIKGVFESKAKLAINQASLNTQDVKETKILLPPKSEGKLETKNNFKPSAEKVGCE